MAVFGPSVYPRSPFSHDEQCVSDVELKNLIESIQQLNVNEVQMALDVLKSQGKLSYINQFYQKENPQDARNVNGGFSFGTVAPPKYQAMQIVLFSYFEITNNTRPRLIERNNDILVYKLDAPDIRQLTLEKRVNSILLLLLDSGADLSKKMDTYSTKILSSEFLSLAIKTGNEELFRLILTRCPPSLANCIYDENAGYSAQQQIFQSLTITMSLIHKIIEEDNLNLLKILLEYEVNTNSFKSITYGRNMNLGRGAQQPVTLTSTCLYLVVKQGTQNLYKMLNMLLDNGAEINDYFDWQLFKSESEFDYFNYNLWDKSTDDKRCSNFYRGTLIHYAKQLKMNDLVNFCLLVGADPFLPFYSMGIRIHIYLLFI
jgi:hypothetical protein